MIELNLEDILTIVRQAARDAVSEAVREHQKNLPTDLAKVVGDAVAENLRRVGLRPDDPTETQADLRWLREWRGVVTDVRKKGVLTAVGVVVAGVLGAIWLGLKHLLQD